MNYSIGRSSKQDVELAVEEATAKLVNPKLIIFLSPVKNFKEYGEEIHKRFENNIAMGSTTIVELCKDGAFKNDLIVLGIEDGIECQADVLEDIDKYPVKYVDRVIECTKRMSSLDNCVCLQFSNAFLGGEESVLSTLNSVLEEKKVPIVGGTAGNNANEDVTYVSLNGRIVNRACVFALIRNKNGKISYYRENIYKSTGKTFIATKVDIKTRTVYEYDNKPAADVIAKALDTTVEGLPTYLDSYPMGRVIGKQRYITANCNINDNKSIVYHARVYNNSKMDLLEPDDYRTVTEQTLSRIKEEVPNPQLCFVVHCLARTLLFDKEGYLQEFSKKIGTTLGEYIGISGYGEQYNKEHFNQTMVVLVFE